VANLTLETTLAGSAAVVALRGDLDLAGAAALEQQLERIEQGPESALVLDLRAVEFMDSSGLRAIALTAQRAESAGRRLALVPGPQQVMRVFDITRMRERLDFVADPSEVSGG
jgi:anti-anti-sigma factor